MDIVETEQLRNELTSQNVKSFHNHVSLTRKSTSEVVHSFFTVEVSPGRHEALQRLYLGSIRSQFHQASLNKTLWEMDMELISIVAACLQKGNEA